MKASKISEITVKPISNGWIATIQKWIRFGECLPEKDELYFKNIAELSAWLNLIEEK